MPYFSYEALDKEGNEKSGSLIADSKEAAISRLKQENLYLTRIHQIDQDATSKQGASRNEFRKKRRFFTPKVKTRDVVGFIRDLAVLVEAGTPLIKALSIIEQQTGSLRMKEIVTDLRIQVEGGHSLSDSLQKYHRIFSDLSINLIRAGEIGGGRLLSEILKRLSNLYESTERLNARIRSALTYPLFVLLFALLVVIGLVTFILPKFFVIYDDLQINLPLITAILFQMSMALKQYWYWFLGGAIGAGILLKPVFELPRVRLFWDCVKLRLPVFGEIFTKVAISRFARNLGALYNSSVPILRSLEIVKDAIGNLSLSAAVEHVKESVREGEGISSPLSQFSIFPPLVINMIALGEETGNVGDLLIKVADKYDEEVEVLILQLTSLLEPFLILTLGIFVGFIVIALFFPLVMLMQQLSA